MSEVSERFLDLLRAGSSVRKAAKAVGITERHAFRLKSRMGGVNVVDLRAEVSRVLLALPPGVVVSETELRREVVATSYRWAAEIGCDKVFDKFRASLPGRWRRGGRRRVVYGRPETIEQLKTITGVV